MIDEAKMEQLRRAIEAALAAQTRQLVAFPPCSDLILSTINSATLKPERNDQNSISGIFQEYFSFVRAPLPTDTGRLDPQLQECLRGTKEQWPAGCLPNGCISLCGNRNWRATRGGSPIEAVNTDTLPCSDPGSTRYKRLHPADVLWVYFMGERLGLFRILGVILDDFATKGRYPIRTERQEVLILEALVRQTKIGLSSTVRDRDSSYRRCLGWTSAPGRKLGSQAQVNTAFSQEFHNFIRLALGYYNEKRLATAIRDSSTSRVSTATLISIRQTLELLQDAFRPFEYGRNAHHTLAALVYAIGTLGLVQAIRDDLGIPTAYDQPEEFIPAAYDILVARQPITGGETNRYTAHYEAATFGRDLLLDIDVLKVRDTKPEGDLETWLQTVEGHVEGYRTAYRTLTGADLGASTTPPIEQQV
jgi:hypothetical protein